MAFPCRIPDNELYQLYYVEQLTHDEIGKKYRLSRSAVQRRMKFLGWPTISRVSRWDNGKPKGKVWQVLLGTIMGDGHLFKPHKNVRLELKHAISQANYLQWKIDQLSPWVKFTYQKQQHCKSGSDVIHAVSLSYPWLTELHDRLYNANGTRKVDRDILNQLGEIGLAVWYMDDGNYNTFRWNNYVTLNSLRYGKQGNEIIALWLKEKWGFTPSIYQHPNRPEEYSCVLQFTKSDSEKIRNMARVIAIEVPELLYKVEKASRSRPARQQPCTHN